LKDESVISGWLLQSKIQFFPVHKLIFLLCRVYGLCILLIKKKKFSRVGTRYNYNMYIIYNIIFVNLRIPTYETCNLTSIHLNNKLIP